jgi:hypothetical protein
MTKLPTVCKDEEILEVRITSEMKRTIDQVTKDMGVLNKSTLVNGEGNRAGIAGELLVHSIIPSLAHVNEINWDFSDLASGLKIDVKTKGNSFRPKTDFDCTVPMYQEFQKCDIYIFTRIAKDESVGWINGWIPKAVFLKKAAIRESGTSYNNAGRRSVGNHRVVLISDLYPISILPSFLERAGRLMGQTNEPA